MHPMTKHANFQNPNPTTSNRIHSSILIIAGVVTTGIGLNASATAIPLQDQIPEAYKHVRCISSLTREEFAGLNSLIGGGNSALLSEVAPLADC